MSKTYIQKSGTGTHFYLAGSTSALTAFSSTTTAGASIYVLVAGQQASGYSVSSISDTAGNTYARVVQSGLDETQSRLRCEIWAAHNIAAQASNVVTITHTQTSNNVGHAIAIEVSAGGGVQSTDQTGSDTDPLNDTSITATCVGANTDPGALLLFAVSGYNDVGQPDLSLPSGHTSLYSYVPAASSYRPPARFSYKILSGAETSSATSSHAASDVALCAAIATFQEPLATKYLKLLASATAASDTGIIGHVFNAAESSYIGKFTGAAFEASLESGNSVLKVAVSEFGGESLSTSDTPRAFIYNTADAGIGPADCTVIEE